METAEKLKDTVRQKYGEIAGQAKEVSCCSSICCSDDAVNVMSDSYDELSGYVPDADLGLGCGLPTQFAMIKKGDTVVDLGSGAGNDCFVARDETGEEGKVVGIDFTPAMIEKANENARKIGAGNVEFILGDIENLPLENNFADVVISNCVLNLVPDKVKVFSEISRILKPGGHFSISDIVLSGELPDELRRDAAMYAGCIAGAVQKSEYIGLIENSGFVNISVQKEKVIMLPKELLIKYMDEVKADEFRSGKTGIFSITVYAEKK